MPSQQNSDRHGMSYDTHFDGRIGRIGRSFRDSTPWTPETPRAPSGAPDVIFIVLDDVGFPDLGCYGSEIDTPNMNRLGTRGLQYTNFHVTSMCSPTRACLVTGRNAHAVGILTVSIHGDPATEYPFFLGNADELGQGAGEGFNVNMPLACGTDLEAWSVALQQALDTVRRFGSDALVIALGVDTFEGDPISRFRRRSADYLQAGQALARAGLPTVFVMEGGYAVARLGTNVVNILEGFGG